jgi:hypothetical protein
MVAGKELPAIADDGTISFVKGNWTVEWDDESGQYRMAAHVNGARIVTPPMNTDVVRGIVGDSTTSVARDCAFDASDYPLAAGMIAVSQGEASSDLDSFSARAAMDAGEKAGIPLPARASDPHASDAELRRFARLALGELESWMIDSNVSTEQIEECDSPGKLAHALRQLREAHSYPQRAAAFETPSLALVPRQEQGRQAAAPAPASQQQPQAQPAGPARGGQQSVRTTVDAPRWEALKKRASSDAEWAQFQQDALTWAVPDCAQQRAVIGSHERTRAGAIERWLKKAGPSADPALLAGAGGLDAGDLLAICLDCMQAVGGGTAAAGAAAPPSAADRRVRVTVRSDHGGDSISECEQQERSAVQADVGALEASPTECAKLDAWAQLAAADTDQSREALQKAVEGEPVGALRRLVSGSVQINSVTVDADPERVHQLAAVRGVLDTSLLRAVFGSKAAGLGDVVLRAVRAVRTHRFSRLRLLHLLEKADGGTDADPLLSFSKLSRDEAIRDLAESMQRLQAAWAFSEPAHTGQIIQFVTALQQQLLDGIHKDVSWSDVSAYYSKVMKRVDRKAAAVTSSSTFGYEPPKASWCHDASLQWVMDFNDAKSVAVAKSQLRGELDGVAEQLKAAREESALALQAAQARSPNPAPKGKGGGGKGKGKGAKRRGVADKGSPAKKAKGANPGVQGEEQDKGKTLEQKKQELLDELGEKDGKPPCWYHHRAKNGCKFSAGQCKAGWH